MKILKLKITKQFDVLEEDISPRYREYLANRAKDIVTARREKKDAWKQRHSPVEDQSAQAPEQAPEEQPRKSGRKIRLSDALRKMKTDLDYTLQKAGIKASRKISRSVIEKIGEELTSYLEDENIFGDAFHVKEELDVDAPTSKRETPQRNIDISKIIDTVFSAHAVDLPEKIKNKLTNSVASKIKKFLVKNQVPKNKIDTLGLPDREKEFQKRRNKSAAAFSSAREERSKAMATARAKARQAQRPAVPQDLETQIIDTSKLKGTAAQDLETQIIDTSKLATTVSGDKKKIATQADQEVPPAPEEETSADRERQELKRRSAETMNLSPEFINMLNKRFRETKSTGDEGKAPTPSHRPKVKTMIEPLSLEEQKNYQRWKLLAGIKNNE